MTLIVTACINADESGLGFYRRLAAENRFSSWREIADNADVARNAIALFANPVHVAEQLGIDAASSSAASRQDDESRRWNGLRRTTDAICPACLTDAIYIRQVWQHAFVVACHRHELVLIDTCPACGHSLLPNREHIEFCPCGEDLRNVRSSAATRSQCWVAAMISGDSGKPRGQLPNLPGASTNQLAALVGHLCRGPDPASRALRPAAKPTSVREAVRFLAPLEALISDWPRGLTAHVEERVRLGYRLARTPNSLLGGWYSELKKICLHTPLEPVLGVVVRTAAATFPDVLWLDKAQHLAEDVTSYVRAADAAITLGVSRSFLTSELRAGKCGYRTKLMGTRGALHEIHKDEVARVSAERAGWVCEEDACAAAGVTAAVMNQIVEAGVVSSDAKWRSDLLKGGPIELASIVLLHQRLSSAVERRAGERLQLRDLTSRRLGDRKAIQAVIKAASSGQLRPVRAGRLLGEVAFLRAEVLPYFGTPLLESGLSIQQLSVATGWKWESIAHWISLGLLSAEEIILRGQTCRVVSPPQLLAFQRTYVPLADLAKVMGTKSSWLSEQFKTIEVIGAQVLPSGARRGGLVRLQDLGRLAIAAAAPTDSRDR